MAIINHGNDFSVKRSDVALALATDARRRRSGWAFRDCGKETLCRSRPDATWRGRPSNNLSFSIRKLRFSRTWWYSAGARGTN